MPVRVELIDEAVEDLARYLETAIFPQLLAKLVRLEDVGKVLAGALLTTMTIVGVSVVVDGLFERANDATVSLAMAPLFVVVALVGLGLLVAYLRNLRQEPARGDSATLEIRGARNQAGTASKARTA